ncbi:MAG: O-methyltransferase [Gammaproteobacteria bacterium]
MDENESPGFAKPEFPVPVDPAIERYLRDLAASSDHPVLLEMERYAVQMGFPIVDRLVGIFLETLTKLHRPRRIFEFGSGYGYSAFWFARAAGPGAEIICSDGDASNKKLAEYFLRQADLWGSIDFRVGLAQDLFRATDGEFDLCYNDVDKIDYPEIWRMARERIAPGGLYIADNVLWGGRVTREPPVSDIAPGWTEAILEHNSLIFSDSAFDAFINPTRDGVIVARRKDGASGPG